MSNDLVQILDGNTFVVSDARGDIEASRTDPTGLFSFDTRFLSRWVLTVNGERLTALSTDDLQYFETRFFLVPGTGTVYVDAKLSVIRQRAVGDGFHEELTILNHDDKPVDLAVRIDAASDFADLFEVKDALDKKGTYSTQVSDGQLVLSYKRDTFERATVISTSDTAKIDETGFTLDVRLEGHGSWTTEIDVATPLVVEGQQRQTRSKHSRARSQVGHGMQADLERWLARAPKLECDWDPLKSTYQRSLVDLAALRFSPMTAGRRMRPVRRGCRPARRSARRRA